MSTPARSTVRPRRGRLLVVAGALVGLLVWGPGAAADQVPTGGAPSGAVSEHPVAAGDPAADQSVGLLALVSAVFLAGAATGVARTLAISRPTAPVGSGNA